MTDYAYANKPTAHLPNLHRNILLTQDFSGQLEYKKSLILQLCQLAAFVR